jgi:hypothetical protein
MAISSAAVAKPISTGCFGLDGARYSLKPEAFSSSLSFGALARPQTEATAMGGKTLSHYRRRKKDFQRK